MKRFEYPLESVLRLRRFAEAEARQALQQALAARFAAEQALATTRGRIGAAMVRLQHQLPEAEAAAVVAAWDELERLEHLALKQAATLADCESAVQARTAEYVAAQRERKPLERLKEEMLRTHRHEADLVEQAQHDELAVLGFSRKGGDK
jgi:flagellar FliJ protein